jgi:hypothetical protein
VHDHRVELVVVRAGVKAVAVKLQRGRYLHLCAVFGEVVVKSLEREHENQRRVLEVELSHCLLRLASLTGEEVFFAQVLWREESVDDAATLFELRINQTLFVDLGPGHLPLR